MWTAKSRSGKNSFTHIEHRAGMIGREDLVHSIPVFTPEYLLTSKWVPILAPTYPLPLRSEYPFILHQRMTQNLSDMWLSTFVTGAAQLRYVTKIGPPQPFWCVKRRPIRYDLLKLSAIGESLLTSLFTFFLISIRLNSQKPWPYIWTKCKSWKSWLSWAICAIFSSLQAILKEISTIKNCEIAVWQKS